MVSYIRYGRYGILKYHHGMAYKLASLRCDGYSKETLYRMMEAEKWKSALKWPKNAIFDGLLHP